MKILLAYPNINTGNGLHYPHGIGSIASTCYKSGHETKVALVNDMEDLGTFGGLIEDYRPEITAIGFSTHQWKHAATIADMAKNFKSTVITGGIHATFATADVLAHPSIDLVMRGECENGIADLIAGKAVDEIPGISGKGFSNPVGSMIEDLDSIPVYDRRHFPMDEILRANAYELTVMAGRGCPWPCTYCCNHALKGLYKEKGKYVRNRSLDHLFEEIELLSKKYRVDSIYFEDDIFTANREWANKFCREYKKHFCLPFRVYLRPGSIDKDLLTLLYDAGLRWANIGIESGSERLRKEVLCRNMPDSAIYELFKWCRDLGVVTRAFNIIGLPDETKADAFKTIELNKKTTPDQVQVSVFHPYPGTKLYEKCIKDGTHTGQSRESFFSEKSILDMPQFTQSEIGKTYNLFCDEGKTIEETALRYHFAISENASGGLLTMLEQAKVEKSGPIPVIMKRIMIGRRWRFAIAAHPRSRIVFPVADLNNSVFKSHVALDPLCLNWCETNVMFTVSVISDGMEKQLAGFVIEPGNEAHRKTWIEFSFAIRHQGRGAVVLSTDPQPGDTLTGAWALWGEPRLEPAS